MSQDPSFVAKFLHNPDSSGRNNRPNTDGSLNNNPHSVGRNSKSSLDANNGNCINAWNDITATYDRSEILAWLSPLEPHLRHYDVQRSRVSNVGNWILRTEQFRNWYSGDRRSKSRKAAIFCSGNPGVGKTCMSSLVVDTLCNGAGEAGGDIAVACFYFDYAAQKEQFATAVLGALLKQVVGGFKQIPKEITDEFQKQKKVIGGRKLGLAEIVKVLGRLSSLRRTFLCLDAIDECATTERAKILLSLKDIIRMSPTTRVFMTGRPHVGAEVERHLPGGVEVVSISPRKDDIIQYIHTKLLEDTTPDEMDKRLEAEIEKKIPETVSEIFRLVSVNLNAILQETSIRRRRERLTVGVDVLDLEGAYGTTLGRIKEQDGQKSRLGLTALMWVCYSERTLGVVELCQALAVEIGSTDCDTGIGNVSSIRTVLSCCQGLVVVDKEGSTVQLIHRSLKEYLTGRPHLFQRPHSAIAETCLTYLNSKQVMALSASRSQHTQHTPFLEYSALYWGVHMKKEHSDNGKMLALKLFRRYERHISIKLLLEYTLRREPIHHIVEFCKFTGLHCASMFGLSEVSIALIEMGEVDINCVDDVDFTPLIWAARNGHDDVVRLLLGRRGVKPNIPDFFGRTTISWAAGNGHGAVVKLLLGRKDVDPNRPDDWDRTPISWAAGNGHEGVVKLLLGRKGVDPDTPEQTWGMTPVMWASENGHEAVVKLLLGRTDVNLNRPDGGGQTPIFLSAKSGHEAVVKLLVGREDVDSDRPDNGWGRTLISWAAGNGHEAVVKLLLGRKGVDPNRPDDWDRTPISWAAGNGHEAVVRLLLGREGVDPDLPDDDGQTPISWATKNGHEAVVKLLLA